MAKELKQIIFKELDKSFGSVGGCVLIDYKGINSELTQDLRTSLRKTGTEMTVVHNRIARRVFGGRGAPEAFQELFSGPTAVLYGEDGAVSASKSIVQWRKKNKDLASIKGGLFQGKAISPQEVEKLSALPDASTLRQTCLGLFLSPMASLANAAQSLLSHFAGAIKAHRESLEKNQGGGGAT